MASNVQVGTPFSLPPRGSRAPELASEQSSSLSSPAATENVLAAEAPVYRSNAATQIPMRPTVNIGSVVARSVLLGISGCTSDDNDDEKEVGTPRYAIEGFGTSESPSHDDHGTVINDDALNSPLPTPQVALTEAPKPPDDSAEGLKV